MKKTNDMTQKDLKTMEQMVADLQLKLIGSENKIKSKDFIGLNCGLAARFLV